MSFLILLLGCSGSGTDSGEAQRTDTAHDHWDWDGLAPEWSSEEVAEELDGALAFGLPRADVLSENILDLLARGDDACPGHSTQISHTIWGLEGCTAETGYSYRGILVYEEQLEESDGFQVLQQFTSTADFEIIYPTGETFLGGGSFQYERRLQDGHESIQQSRSSIQGMWEDPMHEESWLAEGISAYLSMEMDELKEGDGELLQIEGSLGIGGRHLYFDALEYSSDECDEGPRSGAIWIRQPDSSWFQLTYDSDCGCPELTWNGTEALGELCVDTSVIRENLLESLGAVF
jgi:hypothetical protein